MAFKIDSSTAAAVMPTPGAAGTAGWFTDGNPGTGVPGTVVTADWLNAQQAEIMSVLTAAGVTPDKTQTDQLLKSLRTLGRIKLTANTTIYVATTGSDTLNTGLSAGSPFLTLQKAWDTICQKYDLGGYQATIQIADGTYSAGINTNSRPVGGSTVVSIVGNTSSPASVLISCATADCFVMSEAGQVAITGLKVATGGTPATFVNGGRGFLAVGDTRLYLRSIHFGVCAIQIYAAQGASIVANTAAVGDAPITVAGGGQYHAYADAGGTTSLVGCAYTFTGTPAFSSAFCGGVGGSTINWFYNTVTGTATGPRYLASLNATINANGGAASLPGSTVGSTNTGGQAS